MNDSPQFQTKPSENTIFYLFLLERSDVKCVNAFKWSLNCQNQHCEIIFPTQNTGGPPLSLPGNIWVSSDWGVSAGSSTGASCRHMATHWRYWPLQVKHFMWKWLAWTRSTSPLQGCPHLKHRIILFPIGEPGMQPSWVCSTTEEGIHIVDKYISIVWQPRKCCFCQSSSLRSLDDSLMK